MEFKKLQSRFDAPEWFFINLPSTLRVAADEILIVASISCAEDANAESKICVKSNNAAENLLFIIDIEVAAELKYLLAKQTLVNGLKIYESYQNNHLYVSIFAEPFVSRTIFFLVRRFGRNSLTKFFRAKN